MTIRCSIVIPTHNRPQMLQRAVESALLAAPKDGEVIVVDDRSDMPARMVLHNIDDPRLQVFVNEAGTGGSAARNFGFAKAAGDVLFFLDDDDEMLPHYCRYVLDVALQHSTKPDYGFSAIELHQPGRDMRVKRRPLAEGLVAPNTAFRFRTFPFSIGLWMTRAAYEAVGPIDETMPTNSDTDFSCRFIEQGLKLWYSNNPGVRIHAHSGVGGEMGQVTTRTSSAERAAVFRRILQRHADFLRNDKSARSFLLKRYLKLIAKATGQIGDLEREMGLSMAERVKARIYLGGFRTLYLTQRIRTGAPTGK